ncbi:MAG: ATPase, T2SS/T4P/T4SS family [Acidobacteriota bacterium]
MAPPENFEVNIIAQLLRAEPARPAKTGPSSSFWHRLHEEGLSEETITTFFTSRFRIPRVRLATNDGSGTGAAWHLQSRKAVGPLPTISHTLDILPEALARRHVCLPLHLQGKKLFLCMANPANLHAIHEVEFHTGYTVLPAVATRSEIWDEIERYYGVSQNPPPQVAPTSSATSELEWLQPEPLSVDLDEWSTCQAASEPPVVHLSNLILVEAMENFASDIHIEPGETEVRIRNRVDGMLRDSLVVSKAIHAGLVSRIKILANLDISERRRSQDGHIRARFRREGVRLRVSTLPTEFGEKVVLRILGSAKGIPAIADLGMEPDQIRQLQDAMTQPQGMILATGPTGSGKTTTLYSVLAAKRSRELNIVTIEDPIEYHLGGVNQVRVNPKAGMTFANCLRSILRQDPDVILVGEIRDLETAQIAFHASMTGHMVLSSLHTNTALGTVSRLLELGIEPFLLTSCVNLVIAQRLVRKVCLHCREPYEPPRGLLERIGWTDPEMHFVQGRGCLECSQTGYSGRIGLFEILPLTAGVQDALNRKADESELLAAARAAGMRLLREDAACKVRRGVTTLEEIQRVIHLSEEGFSPCPQCSALVQNSCSVCPSCLTQREQPCPACGHALEAGRKECPQCHRAAEARGAPEKRRGSWLH